MMASVLAAGLFVSALLYYPYWEQEHIWSGAQPPDKTATERHFMLHFTPRYRWEDGLVLVEYQFDGPREEYYEYSLNRLVPIYLYAHETRTLIASGSDSGPVGDKGQLYLMYADECSRRYEITEAAARYIEERDPRFKLAVSREPVSASDMRFRSSGFWIDDPDHNPDFW